jgi:acylphosphatase
MIADSGGVGGGPAEDPVRLTVWVHGRVQGVGMRWWIRSRALERDLAGWARNTDDGRVEVVAEGPRAALQALLDTLREGAGRPGHVTAVTDRWSSAAGGLSGFVER